MEISVTQKRLYIPSCYIIFYVIYENTPQSLINFKYLMTLNITNLWDSAMEVLDINPLIVHIFGVSQWIYKVDIYIYLYLL